MHTPAAAACGGIMNSLVVEVAIGLIFVFAVFGLLVTTLTEAVARFLGLRGEYLLRGIRTLVDGGGDFQLDDLRLRSLTRTKKKVQVAPTGSTPRVVTVMTHDLVKATADKGDMPQQPGNADLTRSERRSLPSYVSSRAFARALLDSLVPNAAGATALTTLTEHVSAWPASDALRSPLLSMIQEANGDMRRFRRLVEQWYDDQMARVSGWYKRHTRWISLALGSVLVLAFNVNAVSLTRMLYSDQALRESVVSQAVQASDCGDKEPADCLSDVRDTIEKAHGSGLPLGWGAVPACRPANSDCSAAERHGLADPRANGWADFRFLLLLGLGFALMVATLLPGARFWFDLLSRLGSLRSSGPRPAPAPAS